MRNHHFSHDKINNSCSIRKISTAVNSKDHRSIPWYLPSIQVLPLVTENRVAIETIEFMKSHFSTIQ